MESSLAVILEPMSNPEQDGAAGPQWRWATIHACSLQKESSPGCCGARTAALIGCGMSARKCLSLSSVCFTGLGKLWSCLTWCEDFTGMSKRAQRRTWTPR